MEQQYQMQLIFEIPNTTLYDVQGNKATIIDKGPLAIYELKSHHLVILKLGSWQYSLSKDIPVMSQTQSKKKMYAFPKQNGNFGILLDSQTSDEQESVLEHILETNADFVVSTPGLEDNSSQQKSLGSGAPEIEQKESTSKKIQGFLQKGGDFIRSGLITGAGYLAEGIQSGGQYIRSKITKPSKKEVKPETIQKVKMAKATSSAILIFTQTQISALIAGAKTIGSEISDQVGSSETGQKIKSHKNYDDAKNIAKGTVHALAAVYDGMFEGLCAIGRGIQGATTNVVQAKYGDGAGQLAHESFETAANVGNLTQAYKTEAIKAIHQGTESKIYQ